MMEYFFQSKFCLSVFIRQPAQHVSSLQLKFPSHCWTPQRGGQAVVWWRICSKLWPLLRNIRGKWFDELFESCNKVSESSYCNCPLGDGRSSQWGVQRADRQLSKSELSLVNSCLGVYNFSMKHEKTSHKQKHTDVRYPRPYDSQSQLWQKKNENDN